MASVLSRALKRLANPRSIRGRLWACVYCGTFSQPPEAAETED